VSPDAALAASDSQLFLQSKPSRSARPGEEVQVDFGLGAPIDDGAGRARRSWVFRMVLSYSRKAYSEAVSRQDTETFCVAWKTAYEPLAVCRCC